MKFFSFLFVICFLIFSPFPVSAHGFGERYDLPLPLSYFMVGAAATVGLSFLIIGWFFSQSSYAKSYWTLDLFSLKYMKFILNLISFILGFVAVGILVLCIVVGLWGTQEALESFSPTFVWIIWWVGIGYFVALVGNIWLVINPWMVLYNYYETVSYTHLTLPTKRIV